MVYVNNVGARIPSESHLTQKTRQIDETLLYRRHANSPAHNNTAVDPDQRVGSPSCCPDTKVDVSRDMVCYPSLHTRTTDCVRHLGTAAAYRACTPSGPLRIPHGHSARERTRIRRP